MFTLQRMASSGGVQLALAPNYLRQFRDSSSLELRRLSAVQFMAVWEHYDTDGGVTSRAVNNKSAKFSQYSNPKNLLIMLIAWSIME